MALQFISEPIKPNIATVDTSRMAVGEPGLPREFVWRKKTFRITEVKRTWRETGPCHHGSREQYVRKHWYEVLTDTGERMRIYFERQPRPGQHKRDRWWLFSVENERRPLMTGNDF